MTVAGPSFPFAPIALSKGVQLAGLAPDPIYFCRAMTSACKNGGTNRVGYARPKFRRDDLRHSSNISAGTKLDLKCGIAMI